MDLLLFKVLLCLCGLNSFVIPAICALLLSSVHFYSASHWLAFLNELRRRTISIDNYAAIPN